MQGVLAPRALWGWEDLTAGAFSLGASLAPSQMAGGAHLHLPPCKICFSCQLVCQSCCSSRKLSKLGFCLRPVAAPGSPIGQFWGRPHTNFLLFKAPFLVHKKILHIFCSREALFRQVLRGPLSLARRQRLCKSIFSTLLVLHCENSVARGFLSISGSVEAKSGLSFKDLESSCLIFYSGI